MDLGSVRHWGGACVECAACVAWYPSNRRQGAVKPPRPAAAKMETDVWDASNSFSVEGNSLALDPDQYDTDIDDIPDPGLLEEKKW